MLQFFHCPWIFFRLTNGCELLQVETQAVEKEVEVPVVLRQEVIVEMPQVQVAEVIREMPKEMTQQVVKEVPKYQRLICFKGQTNLK